jgi:hypothetical protein
MELDQEEFKTLRDKGFILKKNILNKKQIDKVKNLVKDEQEGKNTSRGYFPINFKTFLLKLIKLEFKKFYGGLYLMNIKSKMNLDKKAKDFFNAKCKLKLVDGYHNTPTVEDILPWHTDRAYYGYDPERLPLPENIYLRFLFYLTSVGPKNGCTSYIPESHKITYAVRTLIFEKKIKQMPFRYPRELVELINYKNNYEIIAKRLESKKLIDDFLKNNKLAHESQKSHVYDFKANAGDVLIFNDGGYHRGSSPSISERVIFRYVYSNQQFSDISN